MGKRSDNFPRGRNESVVYELFPFLLHALICGGNGIGACHESTLLCWHTISFKRSILFWASVCPTLPMRACVVCQGGIHWPGRLIKTHLPMRGKTVFYHPFLPSHLVSPSHSFFAPIPLCGRGWQVRRKNDTPENFFFQLKRRKGRKENAEFVPLFTPIRGMEWILVTPPVRWCLTRFVPVGGPSVSCRRRRSFLHSNEASPH